MSLAAFRSPKLARSDSALIVLVALLLAFGLVMIYSSSVVVAFERYGSNTYFVARQLLFLFLGVGIWAICSQIRYTFWKERARLLLLVTLLLLLSVFLFGAGRVGGAHRWIEVGNFFIQPSEFAKLTFILYFAWLLERKAERISEFKYAFFPIAGLVALVALLIIAEPDLGTTGIFVLIAASMYFVAGAPLRQLLIGASGLLVAFLGLVLTAPYRLARLKVFLQPGVDPEGVGYHLKNALIAIGSGGVFGLGFGQSRQKYLYLPSAHTDSIIAIAAEELGFVRLLLVLLIYLLLVYRAVRIARRAPDEYAKLVSTGIAAWFFFQFFINLSANLALLPLTGIPLPFISYGGSSLLASLAAIGILSNISKYAVD